MLSKRLYGKDRIAEEATTGTPNKPHQDSSETGTTRRDFLKASTVTATAAATGTLGIRQSLYAAGSDIIRVGMIGCGGRNTGAAVQALTADAGARLVAMCDIFMDRVRTKRDILKEKKPDQVIVDDDHCFAGFDGLRMQRSFIPFTP